MIAAQVPIKCRPDECTHTQNEILFSHKKEGILTFAEMWMDLQNIVLHEISQTEKDKYCMASLICGI